MEGRKRYLDEMTGHGPFREEKRVDRPNILVISMDMVPVEFYLGGCIRAPNLQRLREEEIFFSRAYCTSPLCSPSRAAYLSGRHSYITTNSERAHDGHAIHLRPDDILFPEYLKAVGYHARHVGKCHVGAQKFIQIFGENAAPWDRWSPPWFDDDAYIAFLQQRGCGRISFAREIVGRGLTGEGRGSSYGGWIAAQQGKPFPQEATYPAFLVERAIETLESRDDGERPFYLQLDFFGPHQPFAIPAGMEEREKEIREEMELPESYQKIRANGFRPPWVEPWVYHIYRRNWGLQDAETVLDYRVANQLQFELIDGMIGRLFAYLREQGLYDDTWIFVIADHGEMNGEWGLVDKGAYLNPRVIQAPIFVKPAGSSPLTGRKREVTAPVSLLDLAPTMLEIAGVSTEARLDGVNLLETISGAERPADRPILFEVWSHVIPNPCVGTVFRGEDGGDYMFSFNATDPMDELYRLNGGVEMLNLWDVDAYRGRLAQAVTELHARLSRDERWKSYRGFLEISYPETLAAGGDRQLFV